MMSLRELTNWPPLLIYLQEDLNEEWRTWSPREIKKACQRVEKVADALEIFKDNLPKITINDGAAGNVGHIEDLTETRVDQPALRVEDEAEPEVNKVKIDEAEVEAEEIISPEDPDPVDEELEELDEPLGMGLKFDEIEEMIDEVLSMEN